MTLQDNFLAWETREANSSSSRLLSKATLIRVLGRICDETRKKVTPYDFIIVRQRKNAHVTTALPAAVSQSWQHYLAPIKGI